MDLIFENADVDRNFKPKISIAIRLKNEGRYLERLIGSILSQTICSETELICLDSGSSDNSVEVLKKYAHKVYGINPRDFQFGRSCNQIAARCRGKYILLMSAHVVIVERDSLERAAKILDDDASIAAIYLRQITKGVRDIDYSSYENLFLKMRFPMKSFAINTVKDGKLPISNAAVLMRASTWREFQFPECLASEDFLWAKQVTENGWKLHYLGDVSIVHNHNEAPNKILERVRLNKVAKYGRRAMPIKATKLFFAIFLGLIVREKTSLRVAFDYARAHSLAYI
jgi:rhamnosyltransferase